MTSSEWLTLVIIQQTKANQLPDARSKDIEALIALTIIDLVKEQTIVLQQNKLLLSESCIRIQRFSLMNLHQQVSSTADSHHS